MKIMDRVDGKYTMTNGSLVTYSELPQDEKIRLYMSEHGCSLEDATVEILQVEEDQEREESRKEYSQDPNIAEDPSGNFIELEGVEEDQSIRQYMKDNDCDYQAAYMEIASSKTEEGESGRFSGEINNGVTKLKDNDSGKVASFSEDDIKSYQDKHDCCYVTAEKAIYGRAINRLKAAC